MIKFVGTKERFYPCDQFDGYGAKAGINKVVKPSLVRNHIRVPEHECSMFNKLIRSPSPVGGVTPIPGRPGRSALRGPVVEDPPCTRRTLGGLCADRSIVLVCAQWLVRGVEGVYIV